MPLVTFTEIADQIDDAISALRNYQRRDRVVRNDTIEKLEDLLESVTETIRANTPPPDETEAEKPGAISEPAKAIEPARPAPIEPAKPAIPSPAPDPAPAPAPADASKPKDASPRPNGK